MYHVAESQQVVRKTNKLLGKEFDDEQFKQFVNKHEHMEINVQGKRPKLVNVKFTLDSNFIGVLKKKNISL